MADPSISIEIRPDPMAVRDALARARAAWADQGAAEALCAAAEQVLAEALNNVVEHAQEGRPEGRILLITRLVPGGLECELRDDGRPMPGGTMPDGALAGHGAELSDLPEGGFGWFMIRSMTRGLGYRREDGWNCLRFTIPAAG